MLIFSLSCGRLKGDFALKKFGDDFYRKAEMNLQFNSRERINWIYKVNSVRGRRKIGVILLKKDLSWIDISKRSDYVDDEKMTIYGEIYGLSPGSYRIILTEVMANNRSIDQLDFSVYTEKD